MDWLADDGTLNALVEDFDCIIGGVLPVLARQ